MAALNAPMVLNLFLAHTLAAARFLQCALHMPWLGAGLGTARWEPSLPVPLALACASRLQWGLAHKVPPSPLHRSRLHTTAVTPFLSASVTRGFPTPIPLSAQRLSSSVERQEGDDDEQQRDGKGGHQVVCDQAWVLCLSIAPGGELLWQLLCATVFTACDEFTGYI
ncbi:hypothetical protein V8C86DRAFT_2888806 [Haematococcus lacustris]